VDGRASHDLRLRPGALPSDVQAGLDDNARTRDPLQAHGLGWALSLIPHEILGPFHDDPKRYSIRELTELTDRGLVVAVTPCADEPGPSGLAVV
jgi:hypothetical protein